MPYLFLFFFRKKCLLFLLLNDKISVLAVFLCSDPIWRENKALDFQKIIKIIKKKFNKA